MLACWGIDDIEHFALVPSYLGCVYIFGCVLIVRDPIPFNNCKSPKKKKWKRKEKKRKKRKIKSCCEKQPKQPKKKTRRRKKEKKNE